MDQPKLSDPPDGQETDHIAPDQLIKSTPCSSRSTTPTTTTNQDNTQLRDTEKGDFCKVCGDKAIGLNYGVKTCKSCKDFFRRSREEPILEECKYGGMCDMRKKSLQCCVRCRLKKCVKTGMRFNGLLDSEGASSATAANSPKRSKLLPKVQHPERNDVSLSSGDEHDESKKSEDDKDELQDYARQEPQNQDYDKEETMCFDQGPLDVQQQKRNDVNVDSDEDEYHDQDVNRRRGAVPARRKLVDIVTTISNEEFAANIADFSDTLTSLDFAPPTRRLDSIINRGNIAYFMTNPGRIDLFGNEKLRNMYNKSSQEPAAKYCGIRNCRLNPEKLVIEYLVVPNADKFKPAEWTTFESLSERFSRMLEIFINTKQPQKHWRLMVRLSILQKQRETESSERTMTSVEPEGEDRDQNETPKEDSDTEERARSPKSDCQRLSRTKRANQPTNKNDDRLGDSSESDGEEAPITSNETAKTFPIDKLLEVRPKNGVLHFKVKWTGYSPKENSWVPSDQLDGGMECPAVGEYTKKYELKYRAAKNKITKREAAAEYHPPKHLLDDRELQTYEKEREDDNMDFEFLKEHKGDMLDQGKYMDYEYIIDWNQKHQFSSLTLKVAGERNQEYSVEFEKVDSNDDKSIAATELNAHHMMNEEEYIGDMESNQEPEVAEKSGAAVSLNGSSGNMEPVSPSASIEKPHTPPASHECFSNSTDVSGSLQLDVPPNKPNQSFVNANPTPEPSDNGGMDSKVAEPGVTTTEPCSSEDPNISQEHPVMPNGEQEDRLPTTADDSDIVDESTAEDKEVDADSGEEKDADGLEKEENDHDDSTPEMAAPDQIFETDYGNDPMVENAKPSPFVDVSDQVDMEQGQAQNGHEHHGIDCENGSPMVLTPGSSGDQPIAPSERKEEGSSVASQLALGGSALLSVFAELPKYHGYYLNTKEVLELFQRVMKKIDGTGLASLIRQCDQRSDLSQQVKSDELAVLLQCCYNCITKKSATTDFIARQSTPSEIPGVGIKKLLEELAQSMDLYYYLEFQDLQKRIEIDSAKFNATDLVPTNVLRMVVSATKNFLYSSHRDVWCKIDLPTIYDIPLLIPSSKLMDTIFYSLQPYCTKFCEQVTTAISSLPPESGTNLQQVFEMTDVVLRMLIKRTLPPSSSSSETVRFPDFAKVLENIYLVLNVALEDTPRRLVESRKNVAKAMKDLKDHRVPVEIVELAVQMIIFGCMP